MASDVANYNELGFLTGLVDRTPAAAPVEVLPGVTPFVFYCHKCRRFTFHAAAKVSARGWLRRLLRKLIPATMGSRRYEAVCNDCQSTATRLTPAMVRQLSAGVLPPQFVNFYEQWDESSRQRLGVPYSEDFNRRAIEAFRLYRRPVRDYATSILTFYAREEDGPGRSSSQDFRRTG
jgi:hypothetical protein